MLLELSCYPFSTFATLTYDDAHYPPGGNLVPRDLQLFLKRLRKRLQGRDIRYFAVGEYGEARGRPHYHLVLFGVGKHELKEVEGCWNLGYVYLGDVTMQSARYVAGYVIKGWTKDRPELAGRVPEFARMSRRPGIGKRAAPALAASLAACRQEVVPPALKCGPSALPLGRTLRNWTRANLTGVIGELPEETLVRRARLQALRDAASPGAPPESYLNNYDRADAIELRARWRRKGNL